ncbi:RHS repeat domain-containing protein, partial [Pseudomonas sp. JR33AA]|uniref:RHS repeat domain-containing protein n=1 Tax=Pseudomonas sp. JR33AA TaxID=2899113 RepID=UPI001F322819
RVLVYQDKRYRYDRFGRLCEKRIGSNWVQYFEYDAEQRLVCVEQYRSGELERVVFAYDPLGRRISKEVYQRDYPEPRRRVLFHWQGLRLLQEVQSGLASLYVYATPDSYEPLARIDGSMGREVVQYFHTNLAGLPEQLTDANGDAIWRGDYEGWGKTRDEWHSPRQAREQNLRYQGQYLDRDTQLHYNTFRYYDPNVGCFIQADPVGLTGGSNFFHYAPNPFNWIDPLGLKCWPSARRDYWKAEAKAAPKGMYSSINMFRMRLGLAPRIRVRELHLKTGTERIRNVSIELNHRHWPQRDGKHIDIPYNLEKVTPWEHAIKDRYRHVGSELIEVLQDINNYRGF